MVKEGTNEGLQDFAGESRAMRRETPEVRFTTIADVATFGENAQKMFDALPKFDADLSRLRIHTT